MIEFVEFDQMAFHPMRSDWMGCNGMQRNVVVVSCVYASCLAETVFLRTRQAVAVKSQLCAVNAPRPSVTAVPSLARKPTYS